MKVSIDSRAPPARLSLPWRGDRPVPLQKDHIFTNPHGGGMAAPVLHTDLLDRLGREIAGGVHPAGAVLTLARLEQRFGVSRTVVREAVRVLESFGLVVSKRRVGVVVQDVGSWSVLDPRVIGWRLAGPGRDAQLRSLTQLRHAVEPTAARLAAQARGGGQGAELVRLAERLRELGEQGRGDTDEYLRADVDFHTLLIRLSGNEMFLGLQRTIAEVLIGRTRVGLTPAWPAPHSLDDHEAVARAVVEGQAEAAEAASRAVVAEVWLELGDPARRGGAMPDDRASEGEPPDDRASDAATPDDRASDDEAADDRASDDEAADDRASDEDRTVTPAPGSPDPEDQEAEQETAH
ncbi:FadR/GntR family transcriptional regulator [Georgenia sp. SUBG003]|uniref:FadR/GntR family transcriptional regulator n=1 Tax=Georgenia sp. SUBG003 TaxID=1497974 RepID=UPI003AB812C5